MEISIVGTGYVGLVTGSCLAEMGNRTTCVDIDAAKIEGLQRGELPIYEPGLKEMVLDNVRQGRLSFTTDITEATATGGIHFIAVGTPPGEDGSADLRYVLSAARDIGRTMQGDYNVIVDKSTVPVGTADKVRAAIEDELQKRGVELEFDVVSNPEFLKEGAAINDFRHPDRIVIGADSPRAAETMQALYAPFTRNHDRIMIMGVRDAEMTKYAANAFLATKISFMNEVANLCESLDVDVENVRLGIGSDQRIGYHFIYPGIGYGGSCFPKDVQALQRMSRAAGQAPLILDAVEERNQLQKLELFRKITTAYGADLSGKRFTLWGLAFKPGTDDMREAPSLVLIRQLVEAGATICAFDPVATETAARELDPAWLESGRVEFATEQYDALDESDALVLVTEWKAFRHPHFETIKARLKSPRIFDGRNQYEPAKMAELGIRYSCIGRGKEE